MNSVKLYLAGVAFLEKMCVEVGVKVEHSLSPDVTHIVVINNNNPPPGIEVQAEEIGAKIVAGITVMRWVSRLKKNSLDRSQAHLYLDYLHQGTMRKRRSGKVKGRVTRRNVREQVQQRCEECKLMVENLEEHLASEMHQIYSRNFKEMEELMANCSLGTK